MMMSLWHRFFNAPNIAGESNLEWLYASRYFDTAHDIAEFVKTKRDRYAAHEEA